jgi:uncharacterized protein YndB with AHSA1/START domain
MTEEATETLSVVVEREMPHPPEKVWRALTQSALIGEWLMKNDFQPVVDHRFTLSADWGAVDCQVRVVEPDKVLSYTWEAYGLESVVTWTLTPTSTGTNRAHGTDRFPAGSEAGVPWREGGLAELLRRPGAGIGKSRLNICAT